MRPMPAKARFLVFSFLSMLLPGHVAGTETRLTGADIPTRLAIASPHIISGSDTLSLDGRILRTGREYRFVDGEGYFDLSKLETTDSSVLVISYKPLPAWLVRSYGHQLPTANSLIPSSPSIAAAPSANISRAGFGSQVQFSGAKSFRFSVGSSGASEFSQSLDLSVSGELADGVEITGSISDRGYDPAYGVANSRLSELDKVNLKLVSRHLRAEVGDISLVKGYGRVQSRTQGREIGGISFDLKYPDWHVGGTAGQPRGTFESHSFAGQNGFQGPYQVGEDRSARAIVPGSETVWLDGRPLERGANKDYTVDYPTGRITFNARHPIDAWSRVEVDYELHMTNYRGELYEAYSGGQAEDSTFFISFGTTREGDNSDRPLVAGFSDDDIMALEEAGDSVAMRSGVIDDTSGAYILVVDSLPDSVFAYVGEGNGDYRIVFSYVGAGTGDYEYRGAGRYDYTGLEYGDYLPIMIVPAAERISQSQAVFGLRNDVIGEVRLDLHVSDYDRNLWSSIDDDDNQGMLYELRSHKQWQRHGRTNSIEARIRKREAEYVTRERTNRVDFERAFYFPNGFKSSSDESLGEFAAVVSPIKPLALKAEYAQLDYKQAFESQAKSLGAEYSLTDRVHFMGSWNGVSAQYTPHNNVSEGSVDGLRAGVKTQPFTRTELTFDYEKEKRINAYFGADEGARFDLISVGLSQGRESLRFENYAEDSLGSTGNWSDALVRNRLVAESNRQLGDLGYDAVVSYQQLELPDSKEDRFLSRLNLRFNDVRSRIGIAAGYSVSEERRNARGITYLEVDPGQGDYSYEDDRYVPDPDGDFIQVEEILSDNARVRRGEKTFHLSKDWRMAVIRFSSNIEEELKEDGERSIWWVLPFVSDENQPYLFYERRYDTDLRILPVKGSHFFNLRYVQNIAKREVTGESRVRRDTKGAVSFKQVVAGTYFEESLEIFAVDRDDYYAGSGDISGYKINLAVRQEVGFGEVNGGPSYRQAESAVAEVSRQYALNVGARLVISSRGEFRSSVELYRQDFENLQGSPTFQLVDNRYGERGAVWSLSLNYGVKSGMRLRLSASGRHADNRTGRVTARGEMVSEF